jgi:dipeptidyl aminopeptidase/acylaminoacyl peptidase
MKSTNKLGTNITTILMCCIVMFFAHGLSYSQKQDLKEYTLSMDSLWSNETIITKLSPNGEWVSFEEYFPVQENKLFLSKTNGKLNIGLPKSISYAFSNDNQWFVNIDTNNRLCLFDLRDQSEKYFSDIQSQSFSATGKYLAVYQKTGDDKGSILIIDPKSKNIIKTFEGATGYKWNPSKNILLLNGNKNTNEVYYYDLDKNHLKTLSTSTIKNFSNLNWCVDGTSAYYVRTIKDQNTLEIYDFKKGKNYELTDGMLQATFKGYAISNREFFSSDDGKMILFYREIIKQESAIRPDDIVVWDTDDKWIEPRMRMYEENEVDFQLTAWFPDMGKIREIESMEHPSSAMDANHNFALVYDQLKYEPQYKLHPDVDLYIKNIKSGETALVCEKQYTEHNFAGLSPEGKYISYFRNGNWYVYNIEKRTTTNLTKDIDSNFQNMEIDRAGNPYPYGNPGWVESDNYIILYDRYDLWLISPDGKYKKRLTQGKETDVQYRINEESQRNTFQPTLLNTSFITLPYNIKNGVILDIFENATYRTGIALLNRNGVTPLIRIEGKVDQVLISKNSEKLIYRDQRFNRPIAIKSWTLKDKSSTLVYQTNKGLFDYDLGVCEAIEYTLDTGEVLRGSLFYPSHYTPGKKYPMIVEIYEKKSKSVNYFNPPSTWASGGFNLLKYTMNDYFVFHPDISYTIGDPGISAFNCVTTAVNKVLESGKVDKDRIGLIGHSFGGYETSFIITQTDMFAAAVAGSPITDVVNSYHDIYWDGYLTQMWRMENQQLRFGDSYYNIKDKYLRNSPIAQVEGVHTPLLIWTGKADTNVNWNNSINLFMALKRLGKKSKLLLYEREAHNIIETKHQYHLANTIYDWMEKYLKNENKQPVSQ